MASRSGVIGADASERHSPVHATGAATDEVRDWPILPRTAWNRTAPRMWSRAAPVARVSPRCSREILGPPLSDCSSRFRVWRVGTGEDSFRSRARQSDRHPRGADRCPPSGIRGRAPSPRSVPVLGAISKEAPRRNHGSAGRVNPALGRSDPRYSARGNGSPGHRQQASRCRRRCASSRTTPLSGGGWRRIPISDAARAILSRGNPALCPLRNPSQCPASCRTLFSPPRP
jgi:hypothetical protein